MTHDNNAIVTSFVHEFDAAAPDGAKLASYFTDDAVYHNIPMKPIVGIAAITKALGGMATTMQSQGWDILHQVANGDIVMNERVDKFIIGSKDVAIPVVGVFELRDGKIAAWRDYFDLAMFNNQTK